MFRRRPPTEPSSSPPPEWQRRFDEAAELITSREQPQWVHDRLEALRRSLDDANATVERLADAAARLDPDRTADELKTALRSRDRTPTGSDTDALEHRIAALRERYETVNDIINRRELIGRRMLDTAADVELLAVQAVRFDALESRAEPRFDEQLQRLDADLTALELARREVDTL